MPARFQFQKCSIQEFVGWCIETIDLLPFQVFWNVATPSLPFPPPSPPTHPAPTGPDRTNVHHLYDRFSYFLHPTFPLWKVAIFLRKECLLNRETWNLRPPQYYLRNIGDKNASSIICESHSTTILVTFPIWSENCHLATKCKAKICQGSEYMELQGLVDNAQSSS